MTDFIREIEEDLRADRAQELWQRYGKVVIGLAIAVVVATGVYVAWRNYQHKKLEAEGEKLAAGLMLADKGDADGAFAALANVAANASSGYAAMAELNAAKIAVEKDRIDDALALYDKIAANAGYDPLLRTLAVVQGGYQRIGRVEHGALKARLSSISSGSDPWRFSAREVIALSALKAGQKDEAKTGCAALADDAAAPAGIRGRAAELLAAIGGK